MYMEIVFQLDCKSSISIESLRHKSLNQFSFDTQQNNN